MDIDVSPTVVDDLTSLVNSLQTDSAAASRTDDIISLALRLDEIKDLEYRVRAVKMCLGPGLEAVPFKELETKIFKPVLPFSRSLFKKILNDLENCLQSISNDGNVEHINALLKMCITIVDTCDNVLLKGQEDRLRNIENFYSVPKSISGILLSSFEHCCRKSEKLYSDANSTSSELLVALFNRSHEVQINLFTFLNDSVKFSCAFEDDMKLLLEVMEVLEECGEISIDLGAKVLAQQWKGYTQLAGTYAEFLRPVLDVARPLRFLAKGLTERLLKVVSSDTSVAGGKQLLKDLKVGAFILKILVKLCELYEHHMGDCHKDLLELLIFLYGLSKPYLGLKDVPKEIKDFINRNITIGVGPLLTHLIQDRAFVPVYRESSCNFGIVSAGIEDRMMEKGTGTVIRRAYKIGSLLLCTALMKKLLNCSDSSVQQLWTSSGVSFIHIVFGFIEQCSVELFLNVKVERIETEGSADLYEMLLTHTMAYLLAVTTEDSFGVTETLLLMKILQTNFWVALFASDVFFLLSRFGNSELRSEQASYLVWLVADWPKSDRHRPEWCYLTDITRRLLNVLQPDTVHSILDAYPTSVSSDLFFPPPGCTDAHSALAVSDKLCCRIGRITDSGGVEQQDSKEAADDFNSMVQELCLLPYFFPIGERFDERPPSNSAELGQERLVPALLSLWSVCDRFRKGLSVYPGNWFDNLVINLTRASIPFVRFMTARQMIKILHFLIDFMLSGSSIMCKMGALEFLQQLTVVEGAQMEAEAPMYVAELFVTLLKDSDPITNINALETFEYFANVTRHVDIIRLVGRKGGSSVQALISQHLARSFLTHRQPDVIDFEMYLDELNGTAVVMHKCKVRAQPVLLSEKTEKRLVDGGDELSLVFKELETIVKRVSNNYKENKTNEKYKNDFFSIHAQIKNCLKDCQEIVDKR